MIYFFSYITILFSACCEILISPKRPVDSRKMALFLFALSFSIIAGIRYGVGIDYFSYYGIFSRTTEFGIDYFFTIQWLEPGFRLLVYLLNRAGFSAYFMFFFFAFLSLTLLTKGIKKSSNLSLFSFFVFFCLFYTTYIFNVMRQGIVMCLFVYLLDDISKRDLKKVFLLSLVGISIHYSGIFILLSYFLYSLRISKRNVVLLILAGLLMIIVNTHVSRILIPLIPGYVGDKLLSYHTSRGASIDIFNLLQRLLIFIPFIGFYERLKSLKPNFLGFFNMYIVGFLLYGLFSFEALFATRINMFFRILEVVLVPYVVEIHNSRINRLVLFALLGLWLTVVFVSQLRSPSIFPFITIFDVAWR